MNDPVLIVLVGFIGLIFAIVTILMPFYVIAINTKLRDASKTLAAMEDMMRNGR